MRPNNIATLEKDESRSGDVSSITVDVKDLRTIIQDVVRKTAEGVDLSEAKVIIAGGRGVKSEEGFKPLKVRVSCWSILVRRCWSISNWSNW